MQIINIYYAAEWDDLMILFSAIIAEIFKILEVQSKIMQFSIENSILSTVPSCISHRG